MTSRQMRGIVLKSRGKYRFSCLHLRHRQTNSDNRANNRLHLHPICPGELPLPLRDIIKVTIICMEHTTYIIKVTVTLHGATQFGTSKRRPLGTANATTAKAVSATTAALRRRTAASNARSRHATAGAYKIQGSRYFLGRRLLQNNNVKQPLSQ